MQFLFPIGYVPLRHLSLTHSLPQRHRATMADVPRDSLRASVFDAFVELGLLDENRAISDLVFDVEPPRDTETAEVDDATPNADVEPIDESPGTTTNSVNSTPTKSRPFKLSMLASRFSPKKTPRKASQELDEGYVSTSSIKRRSSRHSRLRKQPSRIAADSESSAAASRARRSFFHTRQKGVPHPDDMSESEWEWEEVSRPSVDGACRPVIDPLLADAGQDLAP